MGVLYGAIACPSVPYCYRLYNIVKLYTTSIVNLSKLVTMCTSGQRSWYTVYYVPIHIGYIRQHKMNNIITASTYENVTPLLTAHSKACTRKDKDDVKFTDAFMAGGGKSTDLYSPDQGKHTDISTATSDQYQGFKRSVLLGYTVRDIALVIDKDGNEITHPRGSDLAKAKRALTQKVGARLGDCARLVKAKEDGEVEAAKAKEAAKRAPQQPVAQVEPDDDRNVIHMKNLTAMQKDAQQDKVTVADTVTYVSLLEQLQAMLIAH